MYKYIYDRGALWGEYDVRGGNLVRYHTVLGGWRLERLISVC